MTKKQIIQKVREHLLSQNEKAMDEDTCLYRFAPHHRALLKCAVGCLIPDELYNSKMEKVSASLLTTLCPNLKPWLYAEDLEIKDAEELLEDLQGVHDLSDVQHWPDELANVEMYWSTK